MISAHLSFFKFWYIVFISIVGLIITVAIIMFAEYVVRSVQCRLSSLFHK